MAGGPKNITRVAGRTAPMRVSDAVLAISAVTNAGSTESLDCCVSSSLRNPQTHAWLNGPNRSKQAHPVERRGRLEGKGRSEAHRSVGTLMQNSLRR